MNDLNLRNDVCKHCQSREDRHGRAAPLLSRFRHVMGCDTFSECHPSLTDVSTEPRYLLTKELLISTATHTGKQVLFPAFLQRDKK